MLSNDELIRRYDYDIKNIKNSGIELLDTVNARDDLEGIYEALSVNEKKLLREADRCLLSNAEKFYREMCEFFNFDEGVFKQPIAHWWAHIDKVVSGELIVDLEKREVRLRSEQAATKSAY